MLALTDPARGRAPAGRDTALTVYSGISVKMLVDRVFGAELLTSSPSTTSRADRPRCTTTHSRRPTSSSRARSSAELDGRQHTIRAGDVVFSGVGSTHGFFNTGSGRVRWIETQAPQPPERHSYRWLDHWKRFEEGVD